MSKVTELNLSQLDFLHNDLLLTRFFNLPELFFLREVNSKFRNIYQRQLFLRYLAIFGNHWGLKILTRLLYSINVKSFPDKKNFNNSQIDEISFLSKKVFNFLRLPSIQFFLSVKINQAIFPSTIWQKMAFIAILDAKNFSAFNSGDKAFDISHSLRGQQKVSFIKILCDSIQVENLSDCRYEEIEVNNIIINCIKKNANHLMEFLLRVNIGAWYKYEYLLTQDGVKAQHPFLVCFDSGNKIAFQLFLTYAEHLLKISHRFSSLNFLSPPMNYAALRRHTSFIRMVAEQKPDYLDQVNDCGDNVAHAALCLSPRYHDQNLQDMMGILYKFRPSLFSVKNIRNETPRDLLPKEFFTDPRFTF